jgi:iduronate 2-sulfatase
MLGIMVKNKNYRYVEWGNGNKERELYDQQNDPIEYNSLAEKAEYKDIADGMKKLLYK